MKYLLFFFLFTLLFSGCATSLRGITDEIRIPFVSDRKARMNSPAKEKSRAEIPAKSTHPPRPNQVKDSRPIHVSVREAALIDQL